MNALIVYCSAQDDAKSLAEILARSLNIRATMPDQVPVETLHHQDLIGFGSSINGGTHDPRLLNFAASLSPRPLTKAFIFSTSPDGRNEGHRDLRKALRERGFMIIGEFSSKRPDKNREPCSEFPDVRKVQKFALEMKQQCEGTHD